MGKMSFLLYHKIAFPILCLHKTGIFFPRDPHPAVSDLRPELRHQIFPHRDIPFRFQLIHDLQLLRTRIIGKETPQLPDAAVSVGSRKGNLTAALPIRREAAAAIPNNFCSCWANRP